MKPIFAATVALALALSGTASADPRSSHPRVGQLASFAFAHGSAALDPKKDGSPNVDLGEIAGWIAANPDGLVVLDGHADPTGPSNVNLRLSFARAKAVREELVALGVDPDHIVIAAFGEAGPPSTRDRKVVAWGTRAGMKAVVARTRAIGPSIISTGLISELEMHPQPGAVATR
jgi:outer membrane protein OmpA-like peptidoglycan-associated protein